MIVQTIHGTDMNRVVIFAAFVLVVASSALATGSDNPTGVWLTQAGDAKVAVSRCGTALCGRVVWLRTPIDSATGKPQLDDKNPDPQLAKRRVIGLQLFINMKSQGPSKWSGRIYNADDGKSYVSNVTLTGPTILKVEGCVGPFCGGETWSRLN